MVLPINPGSVSLDQNGHPIVCPDLTNAASPNFTPNAIYSFPSVAPSGTFTPILFPPAQLSIREYTFMIGNNIDKLRQMLYYGTIVDEMMSLRFYASNVASARSPFNASCQLVENIFNSQVTDPAYAAYLNDGINGAVANMNNAIESDVLGVNQVDINLEYLMVDGLNQAIQNFSTILSPTPTDISNLNSIISSFNTYASTRNISINSYNLALDQYNNEVGLPTLNFDGSVSYPSGSINKAIQDFNNKYRGTGIFEPLTFFPPLSHRDYLPDSLPPADPSLGFTTQLNAILTNPSMTLISPYTAYQALNNEISQVTLNAPQFGGNVDVNTAIDFYNQNEVLDPPSGLFPVSPTEQEAINAMNSALTSYVNPSDPLSGNLIALNSAISSYAAALNMNPNLNLGIDQFNEQVVGVPSSLLEGFNNMIAPQVNSAVDVINLSFPSEIQYTHSLLSLRDAMPGIPSDTTLLLQQNPYELLPLYGTPQISDRAFLPITLPGNIGIGWNIPADYDPVTNSDGSISINRFPDFSNIPTLPPVLVPDPFANINSYLVGINLSIDDYNTNHVGDQITPAAGTENRALVDLNAAIGIWNSLTTRTQFDLDALQSAVDSYNIATYGGIGFSPNSPAPGSLNYYIINNLNAGILDFNTSNAPPPAETLANLNQEITISNLARQYFHLPLIPQYNAKPLQSLMPNSFTIPSGADPSKLSTFSQYSLRGSYDSIPEMSEVAVEANFLFKEDLKTNYTIQNTLFLTIQQTENPNFIAYQSLLEGVGSIPDTYNNAIANYMSSSQINLGGMPPVAISGLNVNLDPITQQAVVQDFNDAINEEPPLSQVALQQKIDEYNNYSSLVNSTAVANINLTIDNLNTNTIGIADSSGNYPLGTLNYYAQQFNQSNIKSLIGPLKILSPIPQVEEMATGLPPANTLALVNGQFEPLYGLGALLNSIAYGVDPGGGNPTLSTLNLAIDLYNNQVGDMLAPLPNTENAVIQNLNNAISITFPNDVASGNPVLDPNVYFTALDNLNSAVSSYNLDSNSLNIAIDSLNSQIVLFNANSINPINSAVSPFLNDINAALSPLSFNLSTKLQSVTERDTMPLVSNLSSLVPNQIDLLNGRTTYPSVKFNIDLPDRTSPIPIPVYFSVFGNPSDLTNFNDNVYIPLTNSIQNYNTTLDPQQGISYENEVVDDLNTAIQEFQAGAISSDDLKTAISIYMQKISTDVPSVNQNIENLNIQIAAYRDQFTQINNSLSFWGSIQIPSEFNIRLRNLMSNVALPDDSITGSFALASYTPGEIKSLNRRLSQNYPRTTQTITDPSTGETTTQVSAAELSLNSILIINAEKRLFGRILRTQKGFARLKKLLDNLENLDDLLGSLRGRRIEFSNAYIEVTREPIYPDGIPIGLSLASTAIGFSSHHFESLLTNDLFRSVFGHFEEVEASGLNEVLQKLSSELTIKLALKAFPAALPRLTGLISFPSLRAFQEVNGGAIAPIVTLGFLEQLVKLLETSVIPDELRKVLGPRAPRGLVDAVSSVFNVSLLSNGLALVGNVFGSGVPSRILSLVPAFLSNRNFENTELPNAIVKDGVLKSRINYDSIFGNSLQSSLEKARQDQVGGALSSDELAALDAIRNDIKNKRMQASQIEDSIIQKNADLYQQRQDAIRNEIVNGDAVTQAEQRQSLTAQTLRDQLENAAIQNGIIRARDLANRTINNLITRNALLADFERDSIQRELIKRGVVQDNEGNDAINKGKFAALQRNFDLAQASLGPQEALISSLQKTFNLDSRAASAIVANAQLYIPDSSTSPLDIPEFNADQNELNLKSYLWDVVQSKLGKYDLMQKEAIEKNITDILLDDRISVKNLLERNIAHLQKLDDEKVDRQVFDELRQRFASIDEPSVFLLKLLDPVYYGIYSVEAGLMYEGIRTDSYKRDIEIHI